MLKESIHQYGLIYLIAISIIAIIATAVDKISAAAHGRRIPERTLLFISVLGGSAAMFLTMTIIHHKTRKLKFMAGIPAIIIVQLIIVITAVRYI